MKTIVVIPARLKSTRLPEKVLLDLGGKPLIERVFENCCKGFERENIWIACDDSRVFEICLGFTNNVIMTDSNHESGTDRIAEAVENIQCDTVINVQGDEPFFDSSLLEKLSTKLTEKKVNMASVYAPVESLEELQNPNLVKVITDIESNAVYFSRLAIPYVRNADEMEYWRYKKHMGMYAYKKDFLKYFTSLKPSFLEKMEKLEQLRAIENGIKIHMLETNNLEKGIDTLEDLELARKKINK